MSWLALSVVAGLAAQDPTTVDAAVREVEAEASGTADADALLAAARACEERLGDPARALRLYERVLAERADDRVAIAAGRRARELRATVGTRGEYAPEAGELAQLVAGADALPRFELERRADALAARAWPGAADAALWVAGWEQRGERCAIARPRFEAIEARWPGTPQAEAAVRGEARCALDARAWAEAEALAERMSVETPGDRIVRDDVRRAAARGRLRGRVYVAAWLVLAAVLGGLLAALARATRGVGWRARLRPPVEAIYMAPIAVVLIGVAATANPAIAPAVATISLGGLGLAWLSGAGLAARRAAGDAVRVRGLVQAAACGLAVIALAYIALTRTDLIDQLIETLRAGPD